MNNTSKTSEVDNIIEQLHEKADIHKIAVLSSFFKCGKGQYGEGDLFMGIKVPQIREIAKQHSFADYHTIDQLLESPYHEQRMCGALILVHQFSQAKKNLVKQEEILNFYFEHHKCFNNWDLVDLTAPYIAGQYFLKNTDHTILIQMAKHGTLWQQRIAMVSTATLIRHQEYETTLQLAKILIQHPHDLMQKAVGWMLREVGKQDYQTEYLFLTENQRYKTMPRTMLRYAIERFDEPTRQAFLKGTV